MTIKDYDFELPAELIAQTPLDERAASRMLVVDRAAQNWRDERFRNFAEFVQAGDAVVFNNTRVFPARLVGRRENFAGKIEIFLVRRIEGDIWETLARPARRLSVGTKIVFGANDELRAEIIGKTVAGRVLARFEANGEAGFFELLETVGQVPLPPYIARENLPTANDRERYQTVFAKEAGAIAAPTAGLHFTPEILQQIKERGARVVEITLHVGYGTFEPVRVANLTQHKVAPEFYEISDAAAQIINQTKRENRRVIAVGTTTTRTLEAATDENNQIAWGANWANLTVTPDYKFKTVDALLTNFHLPQSSLLMLVSTFAGRELILQAYRHAVAEKYRFYSYGDCMLIK